jgi:hypothetical protein
MKKQEYLKPTMKVGTLQQQGIICTSDVRSVNGNAGMNYGGAGSVPVRARQHSGIDWDDDWDDEWE